MKRIAFALAVLLATCALRAADVTVRTLPATPLIETSANAQSLNFDFLLENPTDTPYEITQLELTSLDAKGNLVSQRRLGQNGGSIETLPNRKLEAKGKLVVFNPLHSFDRALSLDNLRYDITLMAPDESEKVVTLEVHPKRFVAKTNLRLPVRGRLFIHDGHDYYGHHRRLDITGGMTTALGITSNFIRYSNDICVVDEKGSMYRGDGTKNEDWFGFGTPIYVDGDGKIVAAANDQPDNTKGKPALQLTPELFMKNPMVPFGNYVVIDHGNGEFSFYAHMKEGSVRVKVGDVVKQGVQIGQMGMSGDAFLVHLHHQLQSDAKWGEGLPSYFRDFDRYTGTSMTHVSVGPIDSGDVLISK